jgi:hypothetical protein
MQGNIFLLHDHGELIPMQGADYDSESLLQQLLAGYPDLLAGDQIDPENPRRWLLVRREMPIPGRDQGAGRWSVDHLFLDQEAIPTLIEVKRSSDTRIRREVIGQMLDYAANAVAYWPLESIQAEFRRTCEAEGVDPDDEIAELLGDDGEPQAFWQQVKTNLQAGRLRLVFVADDIPRELRRVIEFLGQQMEPTQVIGLEVKQYVGPGMKTLVPRVVGRTPAPPPNPPSERWNDERLLQSLRELKGEDIARMAKDLLDWLEPQVSELWWGQGARVGGVIPTVKRRKNKYHLCRLVSDGWLAFRFDWLHRKPPFENEATRRELLGRINSLPGVRFGDEVLKGRARIPLEKLATPQAMKILRATFSWMLEQIEHVGDSPTSHQQP